jgi:uncharacterized damage-inducible protein DinB
MSRCAVTMEDLLADFEATAARWQSFFAANPDAVAVPCDIAKTANVGELVWHIYAASFRHAQRLLGEDITDLEATTAVRDVAGGFRLKDEAAAKMRQFLSTATDAALDEVLEFRTRTGKNQVSTSRKKLFLHICVHAMRHWAQIGTLVRIGGYPPGWPQDILFSEAIR